MSRHFLPVILLPLLTGCVPSLHALYTKDVLTYESALEGTWLEGDDVWMFEKADDEHYRLVLTDEEGREGSFEVYMVRLEGYVFLDLYPEALESETNDFYQSHFLGVHTFIHVRQLEPNVEMASMDPGWFSEFVEENPGSIATETVDDNLLLTAASEELQAFLIAHVGTEGAFDNYSELTRADTAAPMQDD